MFGRTGKGRRALIAALLASTANVALQAEALAQEQVAASEADVRFDIAAQPLASALSDFARQSGLQVLYPYEELRGIRAPAVQGVYAPDDALQLLLANSGYRASVSAGTVRLEPLPRPQNASDDATPDEEEIVVTGTRIRGAAPAGANIIGLDRDEIERSGRTTVQDVLQTLPQVFPGSQGELTQLNSTSGGGNFALGSSVDLRGLGADATLTLLNGRRLAPAGQGTFVDISAIPLAAIERVEVLADGASATYGAVDHWDTDNPHSHIVLRGRRADGRVLVLPRDFVSHGMRSAARDVATARLGPRSPADERRALAREARAHRPSRLDHALAPAIGSDGVLRIADIRAPQPEFERALKDRARELQRLGLATAQRRNVVIFAPDWRERLKTMELHLDVRKSLLRSHARTQNAPSIAKTPGLSR